MRTFPWRRLGAATFVAVAGMAVIGIANPGIAHAGVATTASSASQHLGTIKVSPGPLVLTIQPGTLPGESPRYQGEMPVQLHRIGGGSQAVSAFVDITMPSGLWMETVGSDIGGCVFTGSGATPPGLGCILNGQMRPGEKRTIRLPFMAFAAPADHARQTTGGVLSVAPAGLGVNGKPTIVPFGGVLAATNGSVAHPVPYHQDTSYDLSATAGAATVALGADGLYHGTVPVTFTYHTDAFNLGVTGQMTAPDGARLSGVEPPTGPCYGQCDLTNSVMVSGQQSTVNITFDLPAGTRPGTYEGGVRVDTILSGGALAVDATPSDNTATFYFIIP